MYEDAFKQDLHVTRFTTVSPFVARLLLTKDEISFISLMFPQQTLKVEVKSQSYKRK